MSVALIFSHKTEIPEIGERGAQRAATDLKMVAQSNEFRPGLTVQLGDDRDVPAMVHEAGQETQLGIQVGSVHLTDYILSIQLRPKFNNNLTRG